MAPKVKSLGESHCGLALPGPYRPFGFQSSNWWAGTYLSWHMRNLFKETVRRFSLRNTLSGNSKFIFCLFERQKEKQMECSYLLVHSLNV